MKYLFEAKEKVIYLPKSVLDEINLLKEQKLSLVYALQYDSPYRNILNFVFNGETNFNMSNFNNERLIEVIYALDYGAVAIEIAVNPSYLSFT